MYWFRDFLRFLQITIFHQYFYQSVLWMIWSRTLKHPPTHNLLNVCHREYFSINIHFPNPPLRALSGFQTMDLSYCYTVYITFCIKFFLHNHTLHHCRALLQSTDQLQAGLPSNQDYNNTVSPSYSAAVNYLGCRTSLIFPSLNPWGIFINVQALHQIQSGGLIIRSQPSLAWFKC